MPVTFAIMSSGRWELLHHCLLSLKVFSARKVIVSPLPLPIHLTALLGGNDSVIVETTLHVGRQRNHVLNHCPNDFVYFLDEDCTGPTADAVSEVLSLFRSNPCLVAAGGPYRSPVSVGFCGQVYNHMTNLWLEQINSNKNYFCFVGGNMLIHTARLPTQTRFPEHTAFGGEEVAFFSALHHYSLEGLLTDSLAVDHYAMHSFAALVRRALLHGGKQSAHWKRRNTVWPRLLRTPLLSLGVLAYVGLMRLRRLASFLSSKSD